jgi:hypothetical protein
MPRTRSLLSASLLALALSALACSGDSLTTPGTATLQITTLTTGPEPDPDGYTVQVDARAAQAIGTAASIQITDVSTGNHTVQLAGVAPNCSVSGDKSPHRHCRRSRDAYSELCSDLRGDQRRTPGNCFHNRPVA